MGITIMAKGGRKS